MKLIPLRAHFMTDLLLGAVLILAPFATALSTNWDLRHEVAPDRRGAATA